MILQCDNNNKNIIVNNIKIVVNNSKQKYVLIKLKIMSFNNVVNININRISVLINCVS
jgi:hypothetical protein